MRIKWFSCDGNALLNCVSVTSAGLSLVSEEFHMQGLHKTIRPAHALHKKSATSESVYVLGIITLQKRMADYKVRVNLGVVQNVAVPVHLGITYIDQFF